MLSSTALPRTPAVKAEIEEDPIHAGNRTCGAVQPESGPEKRFEEILATNVRYAKNQPTLDRYLGCHGEIQGSIEKENRHERSIG